MNDRPEDTERPADEEAAIRAFENEGGATADGPQAIPSSRAERSRLRNVFQEVNLPEIQGFDFRRMSHEEIARALPSFGGQHPTKAILIDRATGKAYGIASGWDAETVSQHGMDFRAGAITREMAVRAGDGWRHLGNHAEPIAAAFMRRMGITDGVLYINGRNPCWGTPDGTGCHAWMPTFLAEGSRLRVYNKLGQDFSASRPERIFGYTGSPD